MWNIQSVEDWQNAERRQQYSKSTPAVKDATFTISARLQNGEAILKWDDREVHRMKYGGRGVPAGLNFRGEFTCSKAIIECVVDPSGIKERILRANMPGAKELENGVKVQFFASRNFDKAAGLGVIPSLSFSYAGAPARNVPEDGFGIRMSGVLLVPEEGDYVFYSKGNGTFRFILQGKPVVLRAGGGDAESKPVRLKRGIVPFGADYIDEGGEARNEFEWSGPDMPRRAVSDVVFLQSR